MSPHQQLTTEKLTLCLCHAANSSELESFVSQSGWTLNGSTVSIGKNESNSPASSVQREKIEIDQLSKLLGRSQA